MYRVSLLYECVCAPTSLNGEGTISHNVYMYVKGFSPVWECIMLQFCLNPWRMIPHNVYMYSFFPVCRHKCLVRLED